VHLNEEYSIATMGLTLRRLSP